MKINLTLRRALALAVVLGLLLPALFAGWQTLQRQRAALTKALDNELQYIAALLANGVAPALWNVDRDTLLALTSAASVDDRVVRIQLIESRDPNLTNMPVIPDFHRPDRQRGPLLTVTKSIDWQGVQVGQLQLDMDTGQLEGRLRQDLVVFCATAVAQVVLSLTLIMLILNARFVAPIKRLLKESAQLARRELDQPFVWSRSDELGMLGNSLEATRLALQAAFKDIQDSEQRFRSLTSLSSDWYWERDENDRVVLVSQGFQDITGIDPNRLLGTKRGESDEVVFAQDEHWRACQADIVARRSFYDMQFSMLRPDGTKRYGSISGEPILDAEGQFRGYRGIGKDTTAAKLAEAAQQNAARLRQLVEHLPVGAIYIEAGATLLNHAAEQITGYSRGEITSTVQWFDLMFDDYAERYQRQYQADKAAGFPMSREIEIRRRDGVRSALEFAAYSDAHNEVWLLHDVTQRKTAQAALQRALLEQQILLDNAVVGIQFVRDRVMQRSNRGFEDMLGYAPGELIGKPTRLYYPSDESFEAHGRQVYALIDAGQAAVGEWEYQRKDGQRIWVSYHGRALDPGDPASGSIWVEQDITERKRSQEALTQALLEQQALLDNSAIGIAFIKNNIIVRSNGGIEQILGYESGEMIGRSTRCWYASELDHDTVDATLLPLTRSGRVFSTDMALVRKDEAKVWCSLHAKAIHPGQPQEGMVCVLQDISARKAAEAALVETKNKLELGLAEVGQTHREISLLGELSSFLQACQSEQEAYDSLGGYGPRLFPASAGALYMMDEGDELLQHAHWGDAGAKAANFFPCDCWALRRGQPYRLDDPANGLRCPHLSGGDGGFPYACLPLVAQGETFGLLFIEHRRPLLDEGKREMRHRLAIALAEQAGLALANIRLREALRLQSIRDPLTGLYNRRYMDDVLRRELSRARRGESGLAVAILDIDYFKRFNDTFGHDAGDHVLQNVARVLQEQVRQSDVVCRLGGEEFVLLLPGVSRETSDQRASGLIEVVRALSLTHAGRSVGRVTASLGLALFPLHGDSGAALLEAADVALYQAKEGGRDRYVIVESTS